MSSNRELIEPNPGDKRYIRRDDEGKITESDDLNRSLSQDDRKNAKTPKRLPSLGTVMKATATPATANPPSNPEFNQLNGPATLWRGRLVGDSVSSGSKLNFAYPFVR